MSDYQLDGGYYNIIDIYYYRYWRFILSQVNQLSLEIQNKIINFYNGDFSFMGRVKNTKKPKS